MKLLEGGNVFKLKDGTILTQRIARADVQPTLQWLEQLTGLPLRQNTLGTTGLKDTSGDLDLAVDETKTSKPELEQLLKLWCKKNGLDHRTYVRKSGDSVHFRAPIAGDESNGFVQVDFMFGSPEWMRWAMRGGAQGSEFKGVHRHLLLASVAKATNPDWQWSYKRGLASRSDAFPPVQDPTKIAKMLFGPTGSAEDLTSFETILAKVKTRPNWQALVADAADALTKQGMALPESVQPGSPRWFRDLTKRIDK